MKIYKYDIFKVVHFPDGDILWNYYQLIGLDSFEINESSSFDELCQDFDNNSAFRKIPDDSLLIRCALYVILAD